MPIYVNFTRHSVGEMVGLGIDGAEQYVVVVKASFTWTPAGDPVLLDEAQPVCELDVFAGDPAKSGPLLEADLVPMKPRVDVLLAGELALATAVEQIDVTLEVGQRLRKTARVFGDRHWLPGDLRELALSRPRPFSRMPFQWERAFGGIDPDEPRAWEPRNPVGVGLRKKAASLEGQPAPNFEHPSRPITSWSDRPPPVGFGPLGRAWQPRITYGGTYDDAWQEERFPLAPLDFDPRFFNCAPEDQQLDGYAPGEEIRLTYMTPAGHERFRLPAWSVPVRVLQRQGGDVVTKLSPDTIIIEPAARRFSLVGRVRHLPRPSVLTVDAVLVGTPWPGWMRARQSRKIYVGRDPREAP